MSKKMTGGEAVVQSLIANEVKLVSGLIGSSTLEILDALYDEKSINYIGCRHESNGLIMMDAYARYTNSPGVFLAGQAGPGVTNTVTAMANAKAAFSPVVSLAGAISSDHKGKDAFQEVDQVSMMQAVSKKVFEVQQINEIPEVLSDAFSTAMSPRTGPVHVDLPRDVLGKNAEFTKPNKYQTSPLPNALDTSLKQAFELLRDATKPVILAGGGIKNNGDEATKHLLALAEIVNAPCATSPGHGDLIPFNHPLNAGSAGPRGSGIGTQLLKEADVILVLGSRLGFNTTFYSYENINKNAAIIHCELDENSIGRYFPVAVEIFCDAVGVSKQLYQMFKDHRAKAEVAEWTTQFQESRKKYLEARDHDADVTSVPIMPSGLFKQLRQSIPKDAAVTLDAGTMCLQLTDALNFYQTKSLFTPLDFGLVGFSYPAGLGIKLAAPERPVISFHGDGGMSMVIPELSTAIENNINTVTCVMNNGTWGAEAAYQKDFFDGRFIGAHITTPEFDKVAELYGCKGIKVEKANEIGDAIQAGLEAERPTVIDVKCSPDALYSFRQDSFKHKVKQ